MMEGISERLRKTANEFDEDKRDLLIIAANEIDRLRNKWNKSLKAQKSIQERYDKMWTNKGWK